MKLPGFVAVSTIVGTVVFSIVCSPLVAGRTPVVVEVNSTALFAGEVKELSGLVVGMATLLGVGTGTGSLFLCLLVEAYSKRSALEERVEGLQSELACTLQEISNLTFSDSRLQKCQLDDFLSSGTASVAMFSAESTYTVVEG